MRCLRRPAAYVPWRGGVAIGDQVLDLAALHAAALLHGLAAAALPSGRVPAQTAS
jgi:fumarylacetoacetase